uniref:NADH-ubiquinone oxidoreductase chain 6 n=1 Tax=Physoderes impexa TaxID=1239050 RepID=A0A7I6HK31_9HEMI|nr:NADH dehydrogenase subunit 6 [Physoderes impexa]AGO28088.1 NADH dehydrogenase subunit 6 [Physoderes impexa]
MFMTIISIMCSMMFPLMKHPLSMGITLIIQTIIIAIITGMMMNTFWFSYILLITMLSGMLVLFIYMASIASNEKFYTSNAMTTMTIIMMLISISTLTITDQLKAENSWSVISKPTMLNDQIISLIKMFNYYSMFLTIMIIIYLFITMISVSFIVNVFDGPLRMKT